MKFTRGRSLLLAAALSAILALSSAYYWPITDAYHPLNPGWDGCNKVAKTSRSTMLFSYDEPIMNASSLLAIIGPATQFSERESGAVRRFLEAGGTALLADDFGTGNSLLEALNVSARFSNEPLADLLYYSRDPRFPLVFDFSPSPITYNITTILMDRPSYIESVDSSQMVELARSSPFSFVDFRGDGQPASNETIKSYPVMASVSVGEGLLVLISDPGMFTNDLIDLYDNMQVFRNMLKIGDGSIIFDVAHLQNAPMTDGRVMFKNAVDSTRSGLLLSEIGVYVQFVVALAVVLGLLLVIVRRSRRESQARLESNFILDLMVWRVRLTLKR